jgi:hypothetical protein
MTESNQPKPKTKREKFGSDNPFMGDFPSEFKDVPAGQGLDRTEQGKVKFGEGNSLAYIGHETRWKKQADFRKAISEAVSLQDIKEIAQAVVAKAKGGDLEAARLIMDRVAGKSTDRIEIEGTDGSQWAFVFKAKEPLPPVPTETIIDVTDLPTSEA